MSGKTQIFGDQIVNGTITNTQISATATISSSKITPPGSTLQLIYNNAGVFAGAAGVTTDGTNLNILSAGNLTLATGFIGIGTSSPSSSIHLVNPQNGSTGNYFSSTPDVGASGSPNPLLGGSITLTTGSVSPVGNSAPVTGGSITLTTGSNQGGGSTQGGSILLTSGYNGGTPVGGNITMTAYGTQPGSTSNNSTGGQLKLTCGDTFGTGQGANLLLTTGRNSPLSPATLIGGGIVLSTGINASTGTNTGGGITLTTGGGGATNAGGSITLTSIAGGADSGGSITLTSATAANGGNLSLTGTGASHGNITMAKLTASTVLVADASKNIASSTVTTTTLGFLDATSSIQTQLNGKQATGNYITALTGDVTATGPGSVAATLATVNGNVGSFTNANITVNAKGLITAASSGSAGGVTSLTGTANQVLVNGTSGSPQTGALTLTLPQSIATSSSPSFQNLTLGSTTLGGLILNDTTGTPRTITWEAPTTVSASYVLKLPTAQGTASTALVNDGSGNLSWGATGTGSVTQNTYTVGTASGTYTGSTTLFNLPFTYVQDGKSLQVMYNGQVLVSGVDYNETSNTSVTFTSALTVGYTAVFRTITPQTPSNTSVAQYANFVVGTASGTYTGSTTVYNLPFAYTQDAKSLEVFYDGVQLVPGDDYTETTSTSITTTQALVSSQKIAFRTISTIGTSAAVTQLRENYVVGTATGNYTGSLTVFNLINSYVPGGINLQVFLDGDLQTVGATVDYLETNTTTVTFNNTLVSGQKVTFLFSQTVAATGTVTSATSGQTAYYASTGSTITGSSGVTVDGSNITSMALKSNTYTTTHTITTSEVVILANANGGGFTVTLPDATTLTNKVYYIKKTDTSGNTVTIATTSSQTIDGSTTVLLSSPYSVRTVMSDGSNWQIL